MRMARRCRREFISTRSRSGRAWPPAPLLWRGKLPVPPQRIKIFERLNLSRVGTRQGAVHGSTFPQTLEQIVQSQLFVPLHEEVNKAHSRQANPFPRRRA